MLGVAQRTTTGNMCILQPVRPSDDGHQPQVPTGPADDDSAGGEARQLANVRILHLREMSEVAGARRAHARRPVA